MALNYGLYGESTTMKTKMAVAVMLLGVTMATVTDVDVTTTGFVVGMLAVTGAAQQQILIGKIQKQLKASSNQLLVSYTPFVSASNGQMCFACVGWKGRVCGPRVCMFVFGGGREPRGKFTNEYYRHWTRGGTILDLVFLPIHLLLALESCYANFLQVVVMLACCTPIDMQLEENKEYGFASYRAWYVTNSTPTSSLVNSGTLMGCTDPLCPLESVVSYLCHFMLTCGFTFQ